MLSTSPTGLTSLIYLDISLKKAEFVTDKSIESLALSLKGLVLLKGFCLNVIYAESIGNQMQRIKYSKSSTQRFVENCEKCKKYPRDRDGFAISEIYY